jgi:site-specific DNA recombinase
MNTSITNGSAYYARTSSDEQKEKQTILSQISALETAIEKNGETVMARYTDDGFSGAILDRPALDKLRADAQRKVFAKLYIHSPDRLARDLMLQLLIVKELKKHSVEVVFLSQNFGNSPGDQLLFQMLGAISEFERAQILERTRRGKLHKARSGILIASIPKFGYNYIPKTETAAGRYEANPEDAKIVEEIFRLFNTPQIQGTRTLSKELYKLGIKSPSGNLTWAKSTLSKLLKDSTYIGVTYFNKHMACEPLKPRAGIKRRRTNSSLRLRPREEWIPIKVPAIISPELFEEAQRKLARNSEMSDRNRKYEYLIKGLLFCSCGKKMYGYPCHGEPRYKCSDKYSRYPLPKTCTSGTVTGQKLDSAVWAAFLNVLERPEVVTDRINEMYANQRARKNGLQDKMQNIAKALFAIDDQEKRLVRAYSAQVINLSQLKSELTELVARKDALSNQKTLLEPDAAVASPELHPDDVRSYFQAVKEQALSANFELKQTIIRLFVHQITLNPGKTLIKAYLPNPVPTAFPASRYDGRNGQNQDSTALPALGYDGRSTHLTFEIKFDLTKPGEVQINDEILEETRLAA